jgi:small GTP-binding protein
MEDNSKRKIILMGLDNAGKTSIVLSLRGDQNILSYCKLNPTKDHEIVNMEFHDTQFNIWDFGGQKTYRDKHLVNFSKYFKGCNKLIYVIDVQDVERYDKALDYLKKVTNKIGNHTHDFDYSIFLHKFDPSLKNIRPDITEELIDELISKIKEILQEKFDYELFKTTIYTSFEKTPI